MLGRVGEPERTTESSRYYGDQAWESHWWRKSGEEELQWGSLCSAGTAAVLRLEIAGRRCEALVDTGASKSVINPDTVKELQLKVQQLEEECYFTVANGEKLRISRVVMWRGDMKLTGDFLVGPVLYDLVVGLEWLTEHKAAWSFPSDELRALVEGRWIKLTLARENKGRPGQVSGPLVRPRTPA